MKSVFCIIANIAIIASIIYGVVLMFSLTAEKLEKDGRLGGGVLISTGLRNLRFFTVLSNLLAGAAAAAFLIAMLKDSSSIPLWLAKLKFAGAASVSLTLAVVLFFLGPRVGYKYLFTGPNLWFHLVVPVIAIIEFILFDSTEGFPELSFSATFIALVPMLIYGVFYYIHVLRGGVEDGKYVNDWYGFTTWGIRASLLVYLAAAAVTWVLAFLLRFGNIKMR